MNKLAEVRVLEETVDVLSTIGRRIRELRMSKKLTLQVLGQRTGLSTSMLSLLERGKTGPSITTLVSIAAALEAQMSELLEANANASEEIVVRAAKQRVYEPIEGIIHRILKIDRRRGVEIAINEYEPGALDTSGFERREGHEYGAVLVGKLDVMIDGKTHTLEPFDLIFCEAKKPYRIANVSNAPASALWINLRKG